MYRVLLVDDDRFVRFDFKRFHQWEQYGFYIAGEAEDGYVALQKIREESFDLAFVDIKMPRVDGLGLLSALKEKKEKLCVIIVSGYSDFEYARRGFKLGAFDYLIKPVDFKSLCSLLDTSRKYLDDFNAQKADLKLPYTIADENKLVDALESHPDELVPILDCLVQKMIRFCGNDSFKLVTLLNGSRKNAIDKLLEKKPYLTYIYRIEPFPETFYQEKEIDHAVSWYKNDLVNLTKKMNELNLNDKDAVIRLFCEYVLMHLCDGVSLETASRGIDYNSKYISRIFKQKVGENCITYITRAKMQQAVSLILSGRYRTYEISNMLGYKDSDYFCSLFKKHYGVTPSEYNKTTLK